ncbi:hypothetical protein STEG23_032987, partial [Scotinomys teguina]
MSGSLTLLQLGSVMMSVAHVTTKGHADTLGLDWRDQDCSLKNREPDVLAPWFLDPGGWSKAAEVGLYFIFPGICTLSLKAGGYEFVSDKDGSGLTSQDP